MLSGVVKAILAGFAERTIEGIRSRIPNVTGRMSESLGYRIDEDGLTIFSSEKYFTVLETGRKPGKRPPISVIEQWIKDKPIASDINPKSLAFLIARKIGEVGSLLYRQGGKSGVISDFINNERIKEDLINNLNEKFRDAVINEFINKSVNGIS
jgi:hypothetical protein